MISWNTVTEKRGGSIFLRKKPRWEPDRFPFDGESRRGVCVMSRKKHEIGTFH